MIRRKVPVQVLPLRLFFKGFILVDKETSTSLRLCKRRATTRNQSYPGILFGSEFLEWVQEARGDEVWPNPHGRRGTPSGIETQV